jgi:hypothetical protein
MMMVVYAKLPWQKNDGIMDHIRFIIVVIGDSLTNYTLDPLSYGLCRAILVHENTIATVDITVQ